MHYGPIPAAPDIAPRQRVAEPPQIAERRLTLSDPRVSEPYVTRSYLAPERDPGDQRKAAALTLLAELLGGNGTTSVLARALQFDNAKAVYTAAFYNGTSVDDTTFGLVVVPTPDTPLDVAEAAMDAAIADFIEKGPDPAAFARLKAQIRAADIYARDDANALARRYGEGLSTGLTVDDIRDWPAILDQVTPEEVVAAAREVLDKRRAVTGWLLREEVAQ
jgi:zinc protease